MSDTSFQPFKLRLRPGGLPSDSSFCFGLLPSSISMHPPTSHRRLLSEPSDLISGIPNCVVIDSLLPRLPWYTRPRLRTLSRAWLNAFLEPARYSAPTRAATEETEGGLIMVHQLSQPASEEYFQHVKLQKQMPRPHCLSIYDERCERWRPLPPIPGLGGLRILHDCSVACVDRKVFVMGGWDPRTDAVSAEVCMLDLGSGLWQWQKLRNMNTAKSLFYSTSVAGKIYVVGGASSQNRADEDPLPEVYDVQNDRWENLPPVTISRSFNYSGLAVAGLQVLAFGFRSSENGQLVNFWRLYEPHTKVWHDWNYPHDECTNLLAGEYDLRDGVVHILDTCRKKWIPLDGKLCTKTCRWEGGKRVFSGSTCAHNFFVVKDSNRPHVYAIICEGESGNLKLWRGDLNYKQYRVSWRQIQLPGNLSMCSEMSYLQK